MPINFDLEELRSNFDCVNYFETGLADPRNDVSCKQALRANFQKVYSLELRKEWVDIGRKELKGHIDSDVLILINDDSNNLGSHLNNTDFRERTLFFLDAHVDKIDIDTLAYTNRCPLLNELKAIKKLERKDNIICIDDVRILRRGFPWGEKSYGNIDFMEAIKKLILDINPSYKFRYLAGYKKNDVLLAYVEDSC